jgi:hypothetical protein
MPEFDADVQRGNKKSELPVFDASHFPVAPAKPTTRF